MILNNRDVWKELHISFNEYLKTSGYDLSNGETNIAYRNFLEDQITSDEIPTPKVNWNKQNVRLNEGLREIGKIENEDINHKFLLKCLKPSVDKYRNKLPVESKYIDMVYALEIMGDPWSPIITASGILDTYDEDDFNKPFVQKLVLDFYILGFCDWKLKIKTEPNTMQMPLEN